MRALNFMAPHLRILEKYSLVPVVTSINRNVAFSMSDHPIVKTKGSPITFRIRTEVALCSPNELFQVHPQQMVAYQEHVLEKDALVILKLSCSHVAPPLEDQTGGEPVKDADSFVGRTYWSGKCRLDLDAPAIRAAFEESLEKDDTGEEVWKSVCATLQTLRYASLQYPLEGFPLRSLRRELVEYTKFLCGLLADLEQPPCKLEEIQQQLRTHLDSWERQGMKKAVVSSFAALHAFHSRTGLVHGDISRSNMMVYSSVDFPAPEDLPSPEASVEEWVSALMDPQLLLLRCRLFDLDFSLPRGSLKGPCGTFDTMGLEDHQWFLLSSGKVSSEQLYPWKPMEQLPEEDTSETLLELREAVRHQGQIATPNFGDEKKPVSFVKDWDGWFFACLKIICPVPRYMLLPGSAVEWITSLTYKSPLELYNIKFLWYSLSWEAFQRSLVPQEELDQQDPSVLEQYATVLNIFSVLFVVRDWVRADHVGESAGTTVQDLVPVVSLLDPHQAEACSELLE